MECNKEEAVRAKLIAEKRFTRKDIFGAKKFALKAQDLYPELEGIQQMVATFDVYIASEDKVHGDSNWYAILDVYPSADDDTIRKNYRKLALMLHPDKNKTIGAEGAFKYISQAWSLLSDKGKRAAYDLMRNGRVSQQPSSIFTHASPNINGFNKFAKATAARVPKGSTKVSPSNLKPKQAIATFWTACYRCKMQYEYLRKYLNNNLLCPNCRKAFFAIETAPPREHSSKSSTGQWSFSDQRRHPGHHSESSKVRNSERNNSSSPNEGTVNFIGSQRQTNLNWNAYSGASGASTSAQAAAMVQQAYETVKREREVAQATKKGGEVLRRKSNASKRMNGPHSSLVKRKRSTDDAGTSSHGKEFVNQGGIDGQTTTAVLCGSNLQESTTERNCEFASPICGNKSKFDYRYILMERAREDIRKNLDKFMLGIIHKFTTEEGGSIKNQPAAEEKQIEDLVIKGTCTESNDCKIKDDSDLKEIRRSKPSETFTSMSVDVPDPDFHVFNKDRTESSFEEKQVWAAYDNNDAMPRLYAMIHKVVTQNPFSLQISWLNSKLSSEPSSLNWVGSGFVQACGEFRLGGRKKIASALNSFSHKVMWREGTHGMIEILPRKGDVWALYRNWSSEWNELTEDEVVSKYDLVQVLEDFSEQGVAIIPLVKLAGFRAVFHRHLDLGQITTIPEKEMSRFSHYIPSRMLTGAESPKAPKGCLQLDPAATPLELLQMMVDITEEDIAAFRDDIGHFDADEVEHSFEKDTVQQSVDCRYQGLLQYANGTPEVIIPEDLDELNVDNGVGLSEV